MVNHGKYMFENCKDKLDELMITVRRTLVKEDLVLASRQMLLYTIELVHHSCGPLPQNLQDFYEQQLGKNLIQRINNNSNNLKAEF